jgi:serine/threonine protein phosphatase PrpC
LITLGEGFAMEQQTEITAKLYTEDLVKAWSSKKELKPKCVLYTCVGARTDLGLVRENNEDKFEFFEPEEPEILAAKGRLYAVADGMGGHASGQIASELALKSILKNYYSDFNEDVAESLKAAICAANSYIYNTAQTVAERNGMGTTCTVAVLRDNELFVGHVGDSRLYLIRDGEIRQITEDHSWVTEQVKLGTLTEEEARSSPFRNVITRSLGAAPQVEVDTYKEKIKKHDSILLCSDGLTNYVSDEEILKVVEGYSPSMAALKLVECANEHGGGDNITVLIVSIRDIRKTCQGRHLRQLFLRLG